MRTTHRVFLAFFLIAAGIAACAQTPLQLVPITPCRVADTRLTDGPFGGPALQGGATRSFAIPQSACNIPAIAAAYSLNVTVIPHGSLGYLTIWPTGETRPQISTMNSLDGRIKANAATVSAGTPNEAVSVYVTSTTDMALDIDGYYVAATDSALAYYPLTPPCRIAEHAQTQRPTGRAFSVRRYRARLPGALSEQLPSGYNCDRILVKRHRSTASCRNWYWLSNGLAPG